MIKYLRSNPLTPFMISVPHSGQFYPEEFIKYKTINLKELKIMEDVKSNKLIDKINKKHADILIAECSRTVLDLNRSKFSIDNDMFSDFSLDKPQEEIIMIKNGLGLIPKKCYEKNIFNNKLPKKYAINLIEKFYNPYHDLINQNLNRLKKLFGHAILIDLHSMPSLNNLKKKKETDIVIGDNFGKSCSTKIKNFLIDFFENKDFKVKLNTPYAGGYITRNYGKKSTGFHTIQIEINKSLYINEQNYKIKSSLINLQNAFKDLFYSLTKNDFNT